MTDAAAEGGASYGGQHGVPGGLWQRLDERLGLVSLRPRLGEDVRLRSIGDNWELLQISTRRVIALDPSDVPLIRRFDGTRSVAEIIVEGIGSGRLEIDPVLTLIDRLVRAELLAEYPPDLFRQIDSYLARVSGLDGAEPLDLDASERRRVRAPAPAQPRGMTGSILDATRALREHYGDPVGTPAPGERLRGEQMPWRPRTPLIADRARFLRGVALLASLGDAEIGALAEAAHDETWPAASDIVREGANADRFYIVRSGDVNVTKIEGDGAKHRVAKLGPGDWFGEAGLLEGAPRNATVRAGTMRPVQLLSFEADAFEHLISPHVTSARGNRIVSRRRAQLERVSLLQSLAPSDLDRLARALRDVLVPRGTVLFRQGDVADSFYIIVEGSVGVVRDGAPIAKLGPSEFFGETALLFTEERTATVVAAEDSTFWVLDREAFTTFVRDALLYRRDLMPKVMGRISSTDPL